MSQKLKVDFHTHTSEDPYEDIDYDAFQLIDRASQLGFDALVITNHDTVTYNGELADYAESKGILLIPGTEAHFSNKHVLVLNPDFKQVPRGKTLDELGKIKSATSLIAAPHPFFPSTKSLRSNLISHLSHFDAIEFSHFYNHLINWNKKGVQVALRSKLPLIGSSDCHSLWQLGTTYSLVEAEKKLHSLIEAVKKGKIEIFTTPLSLLTMSKIVRHIFVRKWMKIHF